MGQFANAMEVFKLLNKSNCRKCNEKTCLAFASKVFLGHKPLSMCPELSAETVKKYSGMQKKKDTRSQYRESLVAHLKQKIAACDLEEAAVRTGGVFSDGKLTIRIFGKPFSVDSSAGMSSDIHINSWIAGPVLGYILHCKGVPLTGKWVPFRELKDGREMDGLFVQTTESVFKRIADRYPQLFENLIHIFNGKKAENHYDSDISVVLFPLPKVPLLVCYWKPEDGMDSDLHLFFDSSADMNANIEIVYGLTAGIVTMFEKIAMKHGDFAA